jgi:predicted RNA-binding Zn ribbon-like protein
MTKQAVKYNSPFDLSGGALCLDFANTVGQRNHPEQRHDDLPGYDDLVHFLRDAGAISQPTASEIIDTSRLKARDRVRILRQAIELREAIYRTFSAIAKFQPADRKDVSLIEELATQAMSQRQLLSAGQEYRWEWKQEKGDLLSYPIWPIAESAAQLLTSKEVTKIRLCAAQTCAWLFLDESRNHSRRWCDMKVCGNRQKAKRHYQRQH